MIRNKKTNKNPNGKWTIHGDVEGTLWEKCAKVHLKITSDSAHDRVSDHLEQFEELERPQGKVTPETIERQTSGKVNFSKSFRTQGGRLRGETLKAPTEGLF